MKLIRCHCKDASGDDNHYKMHKYSLGEPSENISFLSLSKMKDILLNKQLIFIMWKY